MTAHVSQDVTGNKKQQQTVNSKTQKIIRKKHRIYQHWLWSYRSPPSSFHVFSNRACLVFPFIFFLQLQYLSAGCWKRLPTLQYSSERSANSKDRDGKSEKQLGRGWGALTNDSAEFLHKPPQ